MTDYTVHVTVGDDVDVVVVGTVHPVDAVWGGEPETEYWSVRVEGTGAEYTADMSRDDEERIADALMDAWSEDDTEVCGRADHILDMQKDGEW